MKTFKSWGSYFQFQKKVRNESRFFFDSETDDFLNIVLQTSKPRIQTMKSGIVLWRSQLGHNVEPYFQGDEYIDDLPCAFEPERMKPLKATAIEGRANPKGISYLYLSTDKNTAMSEVRPWIGSYISLAQFKLLKDVRLVNCASDKQVSYLFDEPPPEKFEAAVWGNINTAFSKPIISNEDSADYVPTQIITELFKKNGIDGLAYRSPLGKGHNIVLFDPEVADLINCTLFETEKISFKFTQTSNTYFISKYYKNIEK